MAEQRPALPSKAQGLAKDLPRTHDDGENHACAEEYRHRGALRCDRHAHDRTASCDRTRAGGGSTVYRTVKLFEDAGIIERHDFREGRARYEQMPESHHDHLINLRDGKVIEFTSEEIEKLQAEIARKLGYKLVDHRLELYCVPLDEDSKS